MLRRPATLSSAREQQQQQKRPRRTDNKFAVVPVRVSRIYESPNLLLLLGKENEVLTMIEKRKQWRTAHAQLFKVNEMCSSQHIYFALKNTALLRKTIRQITNKKKKKQTKRCVCVRAR